MDKISSNRIILILLTAFMIFFTPNTFSEEIPRVTHLNNYNLKRTRQTLLPIREASGIASDFRNSLLFIHEDSNNSNIIYVINPDGTLKHKFSLNSIKNEDWEDITGDRKGTFWLIDSKTALYEFKTDLSGKLISGSIKTYELPQEFRKKNIESLDYLSSDNSFIAILKGKGNKIYSFRAGAKNATLIGSIPNNLKIKPSGLTHHPVTGNFFVVAFWGNKIVEFDNNFTKVINVLTFAEAPLYSFQPEGIEFDEDLNLYIVTEKPWYALNGSSKLIKFLKPNSTSDKNNSKKEN